MVSKPKIEWIVVLRALTCMAVVALHAVVVRIENQNYKLATILEPLVRYAVPVFIMITGSLLLDPKRDVPLKKIVQYILRMLCVLGVLGVVFCVIEPIYCQNPNLIIDNLRALVRGDLSYFMWYIYALIGLYIVTPILRQFVAHTDLKTAKFVLVALFVLTNLIPSINYIFRFQITSFFLENLNLIFVYLMGYYIVYTNLFNEFVYYIGGLISIIVGVAAFILGVSEFVFWELEGMAIIKLFSSCRIKIKNNKVINLVSKYSFGIYLTHPFLLALTYKVFNIDFSFFPIMIGEILVWFGVVAISIFVSMVIYRLPLIKRLFQSVKK